jgi:transposase
VKLQSLSDDEWAMVRQLISQRDRGFDSITPSRGVVDGILWRMRTGAPWRLVPKHYGNWYTIRRHYWRWREKGTWSAATAALASVRRSQEAAAKYQVLAADRTEFEIAPR